MPQVRQMLKVKEVILVEGRYDKNTLSQIVDANIIECGGFAIFNDRQKQKLLRTLARRHGLIVFTDSDSAGFVIRNFVRSCVDSEFIRHAYIPEISGKERRKKTHSKEGMLGVEGMRPQVIIEALQRAGASIEGVEQSGSEAARITKADMYRLGLSGREGSAERREKLMKQLDLPLKMSADALLDVLNALMSREEFLAMELQ